MASRSGWRGRAPCALHMNSAGGTSTLQLCAWQVWTWGAGTAPSWSCSAIETPFQHKVHKHQEKDRTQDGNNNDHGMFRKNTAMVRKNITMRVQMTSAMQINA